MWRVDVEHAGSNFDGKKLPYFLDREWISTPQVKCCVDIGFGYKVPLPLSNDVKAIFRTSEAPGQAARELDTLADGVPK